MLLCKTTSARAEPRSATTEPPSAVAVRHFVTVVAALVAAWIAAGSLGMLGHPLRHGLTWLALGVAVVAGWPPRDEPLLGWLTLAGAAVLGVILTASSSSAVNVLAVPVVIAALVRSQTSLRGRVILIAAVATAVLGIFRLACTSIPAVWLMANAIGRALGGLAGTITGQPLWVGASFGGVDFLVLMAALYTGWLICTSPPRLPRAIFAAAAILLGHLLYLVVLAFCHALLGALPDVVPPDLKDISFVGTWAWGNSARALLPWNLPVIAAVIHALIAVAMLRWATWLPVAESVPTGGGKYEEKKGIALMADAAVQFGPWVLVVAIPLLTVLGLGASTLENKTIVGYDKGYLDWQKPQHDRDVDFAGSYGMLPLFVESLGGTFVNSLELSDEDLAGPEDKVLLLVHPNQPWPEATLERIGKFVRDGGSLLVAAGPRMHQPDSQSTFNAVLKQTAIEVRYDTAVSGISNWEHCCQPLAHPATLGIDDRRNRFGLQTGASIRIGWPARPLLTGRFAFADPGSDSVRWGKADQGAPRYESGELLGDVVLAAEQRIGRGTVVVLGDAASLHNDVLANSYPFVGRLLAYLANKSFYESPQDGWRQLLAVLAMAGLIGLLGWQATAWRIGLTAGVLGLAVICCTAASHQHTRVLPQLPFKGGDRSNQPNCLAYIDASHLEAYSSDLRNDFGTLRLARTLMRNGYLPLLLPELTPERLQRAGLLISIAPARSFSESERATVRKFVDAGGTFICMAGAEDAGGSRQMLAEFNFRIPPSPVPPTENVDEPEPVGQHSSRYLTLEDYNPRMHLYAAWPVESDARDAEVLKTDFDGQSIIIQRPFGKGTAVVIGDTYLAINRNLESGWSENVTFWRWFIGRVTDKEDWIPSRPDRDRTPLDELPPQGPSMNDPANGGSDNREATP